MGYGIMPYRVNLERLSTRFGNSKSAKRSKARNACLRYIDRSDNNPGEPTYGEIISEMIDDATATHEGFGHKYWYALQGLIADMGRLLPNGNWYPSPADAFWGNSKFDLYDIDAPMDIPTPDDFPTVFVLRAANMTDELVEQLSKSIDDEDQLKEVERWIKEAKQYKQDLVLYYH